MSTLPYRIEPASDPDLHALPREGAFVVEFCSGAATAPDEYLGGRIEHVVSGQAARFGSAGELLEFVRLVLRSCANNEE